MFEVGDCAVLISGGPKMVVTSVRKRKALVTCEWFIESQPPYAHEFPNVCLKKVKSEHEKSAKAVRFPSELGEEPVTVGPDIGR